MGKQADFHRTCRICGRIGRRFVDIFNSCGKKSDKLSELIFNCLNLKIDENDSLPKKVCDDCTRRLTVWQSFYSRCLRTQKKLKHDLEIYFQSDILLEKPILDPPSENDKSDVKTQNTPLEPDKPQPKEKQKVPQKSKKTREKKGQSKKNSAKEAQNEGSPKEKSVPGGDKENLSTETTEKHVLEPGQSGKIPKVYQCEHCEETFSLKTKLNHHVTNDHKVEHRCETCKKLFRTKFSLRCHSFTHSERRNFCCHICGQLFRTASCLCNHVKLHSDVKEFVCMLCGKGFHQSNHLDQHVRTHTGERPYCCKECHHRFVTHCQLKRHIEAVHKQVKKHRCEICDKEFLYNSNFRAHMLMHKGQKNMKCNFCDKSFITSNGLLRHRRLHTGEKPFKCNICDKAFADCSNRKRHMMQHQNPKPKPKPRNRSRKFAPPLTAPEGSLTILGPDGNSAKIFPNLQTFLQSNEIAGNSTGELVNVEYVTLLASNELEYTAVEEIVMVPKETRASEYEHLLNNVMSQVTDKRRDVQAEGGCDDYQSIDSDSDSDNLVEVFLRPKKHSTSKFVDCKRDDCDSSNSIEVFLETRNHEPQGHAGDLGRGEVVSAGKEDSAANLIKVFLATEVNNKPNKEVPQAESSFFTSENFDKESIIRMLNSQGTTVA
ncbi:zinc finger protein 93 [Anabrus simplex]|uniref:zinc finger protein 93 n=1 Tax=Anabrus simplex TaxID=316456 RepID=UPI0035A2B583